MPDKRTPRYITEDKCRQAYRRAYGDRDPREVLEEVYRQQELTDVQVTAAPKKYSHIDFTPPESVRKAAERGLAARKAAPKSKKGGLSTKEASAQGIGSGVARATQLKSGKAVSPATIRRMASFFARHAKNKDTPKGKIAWDLWGSSAGRAWSGKVVRQMDAADKKASTASLENEIRMVLNLASMPRR